MLEHVACRRCHAPNLTTEAICFACGAPLGRRRRARDAPPVTPWVFWFGIAFALAVVGLLAAVASHWLRAYRIAAGLSDVHMFAAVILLAAVGQAALSRARRRDGQWWELKRAPELPLAQTQAQDAAWIRGFVKSDTPLELPYAGNQKCVYYHVVVKEQEADQGGWRTTQNDTNAVDFTVQQESDTIYVPSGGVQFDAPLFVDTYLADGAKAKVWAVAVEVPISVCGRVQVEGEQRVLMRLSDAIPVVVTWRLPSDCVAELAQRGRRAHWFGWAVSALAALLLIATVARG
jgi:hypothetical protein